MLRSMRTGSLKTSTIVALALALALAACGTNEDGEAFRAGAEASRDPNVGLFLNPDRTCQEMADHLVDELTGTLFSGYNDQEKQDLVAGCESVWPNR